MLALATCTVAGGAGAVGDEPVGGSAGAASAQQNRDKVIVFAQGARIFMSRNTPLLRVNCRTPPEIGSRVSAQNIGSWME